MMSGTSFDGVDVALVDVKGSFTNVTFDILKLHFHPYPRTLKDKILEFLFHPSMDLLSELDNPIAEEHVKAYREIVEKSGVNEESIDLVAMHGQTVWHSPKKFSLQMGNPDLVAVKTGKLVIADFRRKDLALRGEGAPITPYVDYCVFHRSGKVIALNNIGGISNVTLLTERISDLLAFDTGPGNALIDTVCRKYFQMEFDANGELASRGRVRFDIAHEVLKNDEYVNEPPPKSTGKEFYNEEFLKRFEIEDPLDLLATVTYYTALTISYSYEKYVYKQAVPETVYFSGGGTKNKTLMKFLRDLLEPKILIFSETFSDFKEAIWFAILGSEFFKGAFTNVPSVTGASGKIVLGRLSTPW